MSEYINKTEDIWYDASGNQHTNYNKTSADQVINEAGSNLETTVGNIIGITDSLATDNSNVALSAKAGKELNTSIGMIDSSLENKVDKIQAWWVDKRVSTNTLLLLSDITPNPVLYFYVVYGGKHYTAPSLLDTSSRVVFDGTNYVDYTYEIPTHTWTLNSNVLCTVSVWW